MALSAGCAGTLPAATADPADATVRGRFQAVTGKTWNHPVAAHGYLYVRNAEEMACYDLAGRGSPLAARTPEAP